MYVSSSVIFVLLMRLRSGNGEIDFEEFLALMTSTEKYLEALGGKCTLE